MKYARHFLVACKVQCGWYWRKATVRDVENADTWHSSTVCKRLVASCFSIFHDSSSDERRVSLKRCLRSNYEYLSSCF